eukprot:PhM_4_TR6138/c0_g1_i1/m.55788
MSSLSSALDPSTVTPKSLRRFITQNTHFIAYAWRSYTGNIQSSHSLSKESRYVFVVTHRTILLLRGEEFATIHRSAITRIDVAGSREMFILRLCYRSSSEPEKEKEKGETELFLLVPHHSPERITHVLKSVLLLNFEGEAEEEEVVFTDAHSLEELITLFRSQSSSSSTSFSNFLRSSLTETDLIREQAVRTQTESNQYLTSEARQAQEELTKLQKQKVRLEKSIQERRALMVTRSAAATNTKAEAKENEKEHNNSLSPTTLRIAEVFGGLVKANEELRKTKERLERELEEEETNNKSIKNSCCYYDTAEAELDAIQQELLLLLASEVSDKYYQCEYNNNNHSNLHDLVITATYDHWVRYVNGVLVSGGHIREKEKMGNEETEEDDHDHDGDDEEKVTKALNVLAQKERIEILLDD